MVDAADLKSAGDEPYGFESRPEQKYSGMKHAGVFFGR